MFLFFPLVPTPSFRPSPFLYTTHKHSSFFLSSSIHLPFFPRSLALFLTISLARLALCVAAGSVPPFVLALLRVHTVSRARLRLFVLFRLIPIMIWFVKGKEGQGEARGRAGMRLAASLRGEPTASRVSLSALDLKNQRAATSFSRSLREIGSSSLLLEPDTPDASCSRRDDPRVSFAEPSRSVPFHAMWLHMELMPLSGHLLPQCDCNRCGQM